MKRLTLIICSFLVLFAGGASAWASCKQVAFADDHHRSARPAEVHHNHSESDHDHFPNTAIHCPILEKFVPTASLWNKPDRDGRRVIVPFGAELASPQNDRGFHRLIHDPSALVRSSTNPLHLFLSVLRI
jgi:hypothetical protein